MPLDDVGQTTSQRQCEGGSPFSTGSNDGIVTHASLLRRIRHVRKAVENCQSATTSKRISNTRQNNAAAEAAVEAEIFVHRLQEAQNTLLQATEKLRSLVLMQEGSASSQGEEMKSVLPSTNFKKTAETSHQKGAHRVPSLQRLYPSNEISTSGSSRKGTAPQPHALPLPPHTKKTGADDVSAAVSLKEESDALPLLQRQQQQTPKHEKNIAFKEDTTTERQPALKSSLPPQVYVSNQYYAPVRATTAAAVSQTETYLPPSPTHHIMKKGASLTQTTTPLPMVTMVHACTSPVLSHLTYADSATSPAQMVLQDEERKWKATTTRVDAAVSPIIPTSAAEANSHHTINVISLSSCGAPPDHLHEDKEEEAPFKQTRPEEEEEGEEEKEEEEEEEEEEEVVQAARLKLEEAPPHPPRLHATTSTTHSPCVHSNLNWLNNTASSTTKENSPAVEIFEMFVRPDALDCCEWCGCSASILLECIDDHHHHHSPSLSCCEEADSFSSSSQTETDCETTMSMLLEPSQQFSLFPEWHTASNITSSSMASICDEDDDDDDAKLLKKTKPALTVLKQRRRSSLMMNNEVLTNYHFQLDSGTTESTSSLPSPFKLERFSLDTENETEEKT